MQSNAHPAMLSITAESMIETLELLQVDHTEEQVASLIDLYKDDKYSEEPAAGKEPTLSAISLGTFVQFWVSGMVQF